MRQQSIPMQSSATGQALAEANAGGVSFVLTELDMAMTFVGLAQTSHRPETVQRNHKNALEAYRTVQRFLPKVKPSVAQPREINEKLATLKVWLLKAGYQV
jgi:hypothetical protein